MADDASGEVPVTFAKGVLDDVAEVTATAAGDDQARKDEAEALPQWVTFYRVPKAGHAESWNVAPRLYDSRLRTFLRRIGA